MASIDEARLYRMFWECTNPVCTAELLISHKLAPVSDIVLDPGIPGEPALGAPPLADKLAAMMLGTAIGDALGSTIEMKPLEYKTHVDLRDLPPGSHITDDTQMTFWAAEVFLAKGWLDPALLAERYSRERIIGIGNTVRAFLRNYKDNALPWFLSGVPSAGNGAVMRLPPVLASSIAYMKPLIGPEAVVYTAPIYRDALAHAAAYSLSVILWKLANGRLTLRDPDRLIEEYLRLSSVAEPPGTRYKLETSYGTLQGQGWEIIEKLLNIADKKRLHPLEYTRRLGSWSYLPETIGFTLHLLRYAPEWPPGRLLACAAQCSEDSDTIAAITGAILGAAYGVEGLPLHLLARVRQRILPRRFLTTLERLHAILART